MNLKKGEMVYVGKFPHGYSAIYLSRRNGNCRIGYVDKEGSEPHYRATRVPLKSVIPVGDHVESVWNDMGVLSFYAEELRS